MTLAARPIYLSLAFAVVLMAIGLLVAGKDLLIPLAVSVMIWYVLNALAQAFDRIHFGVLHLPGWLRMTLAIVSVFLAVALLVEMISDNIAEVQRAAPGYQANLEKLIDRGAAAFGFEEAPSVAQLIDQIDFGGAMRSFAAAIAGFAGGAGIILVYVMFLLIEQHTFDKKMRALFPDPEREARVRKLLQHMQERIRTYIWIKTLMSLVTGGISYLVLIAVGVDLAEFWAFVIFLLNYIPTIGSLIGIVFPALLTLVQFGAILPFVAVAALLGATQFLVGNVLEPRLMGRSLNLSALVVILSLALWGSIWGVAGMFLCVPITVIGMIVFAHFPATRPIAILLSNDGDIESAEA